jgi:hemerythrin-like metal-binding protein
MPLFFSSEYHASVSRWLVQSLGYAAALGLGALLHARWRTAAQRRRAERQRRPERQLAALSTLAGGLSHEFNDLLGAMAGNVELARSAARSAPRRRPVAPYLDALEGLINRTGVLVQQLQVWAGRSTPVPRPLDLGRELQETIRLLRAALPGHPALRLEGAPVLPPVLAGPGRFKQVVLSLVLLLREAGGDGEPALTFRLGLEPAGSPPEAGAAVLLPSRPGPQVALEVVAGAPSRTVPGPATGPARKPRVPSRPDLDLTLDLLRSMDGGLQVRREQDGGDSYRLLFPVAALPVEAEPPAAEAETEPNMEGMRGSGVVLVVDDEEPVRATAAEALRRNGFEILEAGDGVEAVRLFEPNRQRICLVVMNLNMPRMDGEEAYRALRRAGMLAPVILTSGIAEPEVLGRVRSRGIAGFLQKPYRLQALVQLVARTLARAREAPTPMLQAERQPLSVLLDLDLGCQMLDQQHRNLVAAFNRLAGALLPAGERRRQCRAIEDLREQALTHFGVEETLMERFGYPRAREHQTSHALLIRQLDQLAAGVREGRQPFTHSTLDFLESWVVHHSQDDDHKLALFLNAAGH